MLQERDQQVSGSRVEKEAGKGPSLWDFSREPYELGFFSGVGSFCCGVRQTEVGSRGRQGGLKGVHPQKVIR